MKLFTSLCLFMTGCSTESGEEEGPVPMAGTIYVQKWYAGDAQELAMTIANSGEEN